MRVSARRVFNESGGLRVIEGRKGGIVTDSKGGDG